MNTCTPAREVTAEVDRLVSLFEARLVVSPSHEGVLPNVPLENLLAIRDAVERVRESKQTPSWRR